MNFVCSSRAKGFDLKNLIVFPSDDFSREIAEGLGLATFYNQQLMAAIPSQEAQRYGDSTFALIMMGEFLIDLHEMAASVLSSCLFHQPRSFAFS